MRITDKARPQVKLCFTSISVVIRARSWAPRQQLRNSLRGCFSNSFAPQRHQLLCKVSRVESARSWYRLRTAKSRDSKSIHTSHYAGSADRRRAQPCRYPILSPANRAGKNQPVSVPTGRAGGSAGLVVDFFPRNLQVVDDYAVGQESVNHLSLPAPSEQQYHRGQRNYPAIGDRISATGIGFDQSGKILRTGSPRR